MFAEPLVFLAARPFDAEVVRDLAVRHAKAPRLADRDAVRLDLGRPIDVVVAAVPPLPPPLPLSDVGEGLADNAGEDFFVPFLSVSAARRHLSILMFDIPDHLLVGPIALS